ncbi:MAG: L,D-transpeptidase, partial [Myxococcota bacterium]
AAEVARVLDEEFPLHGLVTRPQLVIRDTADREGGVVGWLRWGERVRLKEEPTHAPRCASGWYAVAPQGWVCAGQGVTVAPEPPESESPPVPPARREDILPYDYFFVKEPMTAQYHQLPSRSQQRAAGTFGTRYLAILDRDEGRAARMLRGELPGEPTPPAGVERFLNHAFFIAGTDVQTRSERRFLRTPGGGFVKVSRLEQRRGTEFQGVDLAETELPIAWVLRDAHPRIHRIRDDEHRFVRDMEAEIIPRQTIVTELWQARERIGDEFYHRLESPDWEGTRYVRDWFIGVAEAIEPPFAVEPEEPWVHISLRTQTLVVYRGERPVFATLVSTGLTDHDTPVGTFRIHKKMVTDTMANLGPDAGDDSYRIQDVPWTQYFQGSFALHAAFWHHRFGLQRSHGCVNLSPADAHRVFQETWPPIPEGWHGVSTRDTDFPASRVHVTR